MKQFVVEAKSGWSRLGKLILPHGELETPFFMPIATRGAIRVAPFSALEELGASIILSNTYHLIVRPGTDLIKRIGGLHKFIGWDKPILTDSGGFQIFSLAETRRVDDDGVSFHSPIDGTKIFLTPETVVDAQNDFGSDILMVLDELCALPNTFETLARAVDRTTVWAERAKKRFEELHKNENDIRPLLFGIVQGGINEELRKKSASGLTKIGFDGYAIGGLSVGEESEDMYRTIESVTPQLPEDAPRYLMGVGQPQDIVEAVRRGVDMFDCVLPTRNARHALLYTGLNTEYLQNIIAAPLSERVIEEKLYKKIRIRNNGFAEDGNLVNPDCPLLNGVTFAYLRYLFRIDETMALYLATVNNIWFYLDLMEKIRNIIQTSSRGK